VFYNLQPDYLRTYIGAMHVIRLDQAKTAWQYHVQPDKLLTVIVVGGQLEPQLVTGS
jgi:hypothetical protein